MPMHRRRILRLRDVCLHVIDMGTPNIVARVRNTLEIDVDRADIRNHSKRCVRMRIRTLMMMLQVRLQLIPARNGVMRWYFVLVYHLYKVMLIGVGPSTNYLHGGVGRLHRDGVIWGLVGLSTILIWFGL